MKDKIAELNKLIAENPDLEIKMFVDSDGFSEFGYTSQRITKIELSGWYEHDEKIFADVDEIIDDLFYDEPEEESRIKAEALIKKVILIYTGA